MTNVGRAFVQSWQFNATNALAQRLRLEKFLKREMMTLTDQPSDCLECQRRGSGRIHRVHEPAQQRGDRVIEFACGLVTRLVTNSRETTRIQRHERISLVGDLSMM